jgi:hypothetical protein
MEQQRGALSQSSQMHSLPVFSHAIDQQQGPAVAVPVNGYTTSYDPVPVIPQVINLYSIAKNLNRKKPLQGTFKFQDVTASVPKQAHITLLKESNYFNFD